jgi:hypothetical protein
LRKRVFHIATSFFPALLSHIARQSAFLPRRAAPTPTLCRFDADYSRG